MASATMRGMVQDAYGPPELMLSLRDIAMPAVGADVHTRLRVPRRGLDASRVCDRPLVAAARRQRGLSQTDAAIVGRHGAIRPQVQRRRATRVADVAQEQI